MARAGILALTGTPAAHGIVCACAASALAAALLLPGPAEAADWRHDIGTFRIGMLAQDGEDKVVPGLWRIEQAYAQALSMPVQIIVAKDWASLIRAQAEHRLDYAIDSAFAYAAASKLCSCVEPVAAPLGADGSPGTRAVVIARKGLAGDLAAAARLRIVIGPGSFAGAETLAVAALAHAGADPGRMSQADSWSAAQAAFVRGDADVLVGWEPSLGLADAGTTARLDLTGFSGNDYSVVWKSGVLRYGPHAVRSDLDDGAKQILSQLPRGAEARPSRRLRPDRAGPWRRHGGRPRRGLPARPGGHRLSHRAGRLALIAAQQSEQGTSWLMRGLR